MNRQTIARILRFYAANRTDGGHRAARYLRSLGLDAHQRPNGDEKTRAARVTFTLDGEVYSINRPSEVFEEDSGLKFSVARESFDGILFIVVWESLKGSTRVTAAMINGFANNGTEYFDDCKIVSVFNGEETVLMDESGCGGIQVRGTLVRRATMGTDFHSPTADAVAPWAEELCWDGYTRSSNQWNSKKFGPYTIGDPGVTGSSSLNGSHGGWELGPYHFGTEGWQRSSDYGYMWAEREFFATLARSPLASYDPQTLEPHNPHVPYWCGRASSDLPGLAVGVDNPENDPVIAELHRYKAPAASHMHRATASAAMLAPRDVFARIILVEHYWNDFTCNLDGAESANSLFKPYYQVMSEKGGQGWSRGGRGFAHLVGCYTMAEPWLGSESRGAGLEDRDMDVTSQGDVWDTALRALIRHVAWPKSGVVHNMVHDADSKHVIFPARAREIDLLFRPMQELGELDDIVEKVRYFMSRYLGQSVAVSVNGSGEHWWDNKHGSADYYPLYDLIRGAMKFLDLSHPIFTDPSEQLVALVNPSDLPYGK